VRVLLLQLDGKLPNLALMRLHAHHLDLGHHVELRQAGNLGSLQPRLGDEHWDRVYGSLIFQRTRELATTAQRQYPGIVLGGTGWDLTTTLESVGVSTDGPYYYGGYPKRRSSIGFTQRGCRLKCGFCVVPRKEGRVRPALTINEIWRGHPWPREVLLLDNDFFGNPQWPERIDELRNGKFKVCFNQGINARMLNTETASAIASVDYRDDSAKMSTKRIYTAWDGKEDERTLFRGLEALARAGVKPDHIMVYMLIGHAPGETHADRDYRRRKLRDFGARPYPMPITRTGALGDVLVGFQRWVIGAYDKRISWERWAAAKYDPRKLGDRRVSLPLFQEAS
jgi:hypothetical protein